MFLGARDEKIDLKKLFRYNKKKDAFIIDISIDYYKDLYNEWDFSPFKRRDLDSDLVAFIEESSEEIPLKYKLVINFFIPIEMKDIQKEERSKIGLQNYFKYMLYKVQGEKKKYKKRAIKYALTGAVFVLLAVYTKELMSKWVYLSVLPEGFFIGGWVFVWEVFTILFFQNADRRIKIREYNRLIKSEINYNYYSDKNHIENLDILTGERNEKTNKITPLLK